MTEVVVKIERILSKDEHTNQKWVVWEGSIEGFPQLSKRVSIAAAALVSRPQLLESAKAKLEADVREYHAAHLALQALGLV